MERANRRGQQFVTKEEEEEEEEPGWRWSRGRWTWVITRSTLFRHKSPNTLHEKKGQGESEARQQIKKKVSANI